MKLYVYVNSLQKTRYIFNHHLQTKLWVFMAVLTGQYENIACLTLKVIKEILCSFWAETLCEELNWLNNKLDLYFIIFSAKMLFRQLLQRGNVQFIQYKIQFYEGKLRASRNMNLCTLSATSKQKNLLRKWNLYFYWSG